MATVSSKIYQDQPTITAVTAAPVKGAVSTTTTTIPAGAPVPMMEQEKMGNKCCGCCCDFRRAVIICNIILLVFAVIGFIFVISGRTVDTGSYSLDDDSAYDTYFAIEIVTLVVTILMNICAILGAIKYNVGMVLVPAIWYVVEYIISVANAFIYCSAWEDEIEEKHGNYVDAECNVPPGIVITGLAITIIWIYPHVGFVKEVKAGTMSEETYPREEFSCCCVA
mmetsp:Transcript_4571/g.6748  ORF Transcript_4571/g.6748 Transcript_4571/m.6748 type:complete len:224 (-) Transcript_4571:207-878(-)